MHIITIIFRGATDLEFGEIEVKIKIIKVNKLHTFHAATCWNAYEQFDSLNNLSDLKITSPVLGGGNVYYIFLWCD